MNKNYYTVDRIESHFVILECPDGTFNNFSRSLLPKGIKEGSVLLKSEDGTFYASDVDMIIKKKKVYDLQKEIFKTK